MSALVCAAKGLDFLRDCSASKPQSTCGLLSSTFILLLSRPCETEEGLRLQNHSLLHGLTTLAVHSNQSSVPAAQCTGKPSFGSEGACFPLSSRVSTLLGISPAILQLSRCSFSESACGSSFRAWPACLSKNSAKTLLTRTLSPGRAPSLDPHRPPRAHTSTLTLPESAVALLEASRTPVHPKPINPVSAASVADRPASGEHNLTSSAKEQRVDTGGQGREASMFTSSLVMKTNRSPGPNVFCVTFRLLITC